MLVSNFVDNYLKWQFYLRNYQTNIVMAGVNYNERLNFNFMTAFSTLAQLEWTEDQLKEAQAVRFDHQTERYAGYNKYWRAGVDKCVAELKRDLSSRRAIIYFGYAETVPSCLTSIQFLIRNDKLDVIANFRSWELSTFAAYDLCMLTTLATVVSNSVTIELNDLSVNVGSAHIIVK